MPDRMKNSFKTPILLIAFNRPGLTQRVFNELRKVRPAKLYFAVDGPRQNVAFESGLCAKTRDIIKQIDWDCEVRTLFRDKNLGCKVAVSSGIDWFFKNEERGIILEDDTLPHPAFFRFCEELLEYYKNDDRIMTICGTNFQFGRKCTEYSYYFSRYTHTWGWASWRRAGNYYDVDMRLWPEIRDNGLLFNILGSKKEASYWRNIFEQVYTGKKNTWDYRWLFACWLQNGLTVLPGVNLISNIGFGDSGTHTKGKTIFADMESKDLVFPLSHPPYLFRNVIADRLDDKTLFSSASLHKKMINKIYALLNDL